MLKVSRNMVWMRGALYVGIAVLQRLYEILTSAEPPRWDVLTVALLLTAFVTLRAYTDESLANHKQSESEPVSDDSTANTTT